MEGKPGFKPGFLFSGVWLRERRAGAGAYARLLEMTLEYGHAHIEVVGGQMRVAHRHLEGLVAEPHLNPPEIDPASHQA